MIYKTYKPPPQLADFVETLWYVEGISDNMKGLALPKMNVELILNFGASHTASATADFREVQSEGRFWISGLHSKSFFLKTYGVSIMMGASFTKHGVYPFIPFSAHELTDTAISLDLIWGNEMELLRERIAGEPILQVKFRLLEQFLLSKFNAAKVYNKKSLPYSIQSLSNVDDPVSISQLTSELNISGKTLYKTFMENVGVSPKLLQRIIRFNKIFADLNTYGSERIVDVVYKYNYYDQSHLIKDFTSFTGITPGEYLRIRKQLNRSNVAINFVPLVGLHEKNLT